MHYFGPSIWFIELQLLLKWLQLPNLSGLQTINVPGLGNVQLIPSSALQVSPQAPQQPQVIHNLPPSVQIIGELLIFDLL